APDSAALRCAMLSVYYGSLGRQMTSTGAPAVMLPLPVRPLSLGDALQEIKRNWPDRLGEAVWRVVRSVPPPGCGAADGRRYPEALRRLVGGLDEVDTLRFRYRAAANLFAAALVAMLEGCAEDVEGLRSAMERAKSRLSEGAQDVIGSASFEFLDDTTADRLSGFESEVGLNLYDYAREFADALAFLDWWPPDGQPASRHVKDHMTVYPATSVITQDASTLVTRAT